MKVGEKNNASTDCLRSLRDFTTFQKIKVMFESAVTEVLPKVSFVESRNDSKQPDVITLSGGFSTGEARYRFEIKGDGTGTIFYSDYCSDSEDFAHECDFQTLCKEIEEAVKSEIELQGVCISSDSTQIEKIRQEVATERLEELFWEEINQTLEDPFFRSFEDESEWGKEFICQQGDTDELKSFLELCVLTERKIINPDDYLVIDSETDCEAAGLSDCSYYSERLAELVEIACGYFKPAGHSYDYNDGCYDRYSGYSMNCESITISLSDSAKIPPREKMLAMIELRKRLAAMKVETEKIEWLTSF